MNHLTNYSRPGEPWKEPEQEQEARQEPSFPPFSHNSQHPNRRTGVRKQAPPPPPPGARLRLQSRRAAGGSGARRRSALGVSGLNIWNQAARTTITGDVGNHRRRFVGNVVLMSGLETAEVFSLHVRVRARGKQLHLLLRRSPPPLMISDDIISQSAHKQMLAAPPKQCQLSRCAFAPAYYLYRAFRFVMLMTPCVSMQEGAREELSAAVKRTSEAGRHS